MAEIDDIMISCVHGGITDRGIAIAGNFLSAMSWASMILFWLLGGCVMLCPVMNTTKWDELRLEMYALTPPPAWSTLSTTGYHSRPDREWFYHFREGGYEHILYVDIKVETSVERERVRSCLRKVHVPGEETPEGFRVFGYVGDGQGADYI
jgi:hypothetical protein